MLCHSHDYYLDDVNDESEIEDVEHIKALRGNSIQRSFEVRDKYKNNFLSPNGVVPWQYKMVRRERIN